MWSKLAIVALLGALVNGANKNNVTSNYVIYDFDTTLFPYAVGKCQTGSIQSPVSYMFTCSADKKYVTVKSYSVYGCTGTPTATTLLFNNGTNYNSQYKGGFNCDGTDDYVYIGFEIGTCPVVNSKVFASINSCIRVLTQAGYQYLNLYCYDDKAEMQYFATSSCSGTTTVTYTANETCGYMFPFGTTIKIYGQVLNCTQGTMVEPESSSNSLTSLFSFIIAVFALFFY